jgi:hypothetical protein
MAKRGRPFERQVATKATIEPGIMPLDYMISVIRDPTATKHRRDKMAIAAAPYCHPRLTEPVRIGKKDVQKDDAKAAGMGWMGDLSWREGDRPS